MDTLSRDPNDWWRDMIIPAVLFLVLMLIGWGAISWSKASTSAHYQSLYPIWCKTYHRQDLSYDEWRAMYRAGLLPKTVSP